LSFFSGENSGILYGSSPLKSYFSYKEDFLKGLLLLLVFLAVNRLNASTLYHSIRSQSTLKFYVIFNVFEVLDRLFASIGLDILDSFFSLPVEKSAAFSPIFHFFLCFLYISNSFNIVLLSLML
jgi:hypothetical protein